MKENRKTSNMNIRLKNETYELIKELAWRQRKTVSDIVRQLIDEYIKEADTIDK